MQRPAEILRLQNWSIIVLITRGPQCTGKIDKVAVMRVTIMSVIFRANGDISKYPLAASKR